MTAPPARLPRLPFVILGLMTAFTLGGPLVIGYALKGGASPVWPPDRAVEWLAVALISGMVFGLMLACLSLSLVNRKVSKGEVTSPDRGPDRTGVEP